MKRTISRFLTFAMVLSFIVIPKPTKTFAESGGSWSVSGAKSYETENGIGISFVEGNPVMTYRTDSAMTGSVVVEFDLKANGAKQSLVNAYSEEGAHFFYLDTKKNIWITYDGWKQKSLTYQMGEFSENHFVYIIDVKNQTYSLYMDGNDIYEDAGYINSTNNFKTISFTFANLFGDLEVSAEINNMKVYNKEKAEFDKEKYGELPEKKVDYFSDIKSEILNNKVFMIGSGTVLENFKTTAYDMVVYEENGVCYIPRIMIDKNSKINDYVTAESVGAVRNGKFLAVGTNQENFLKKDFDIKTERIFGIFVSPEGDDENNGTIEKPLKTIFAAKELIKTVRAETGIPNGGIQVYFREGEYNISSSIVFDKSDSGSEKAPITYRAYPEENAKITGSKVLPSEKFKKIENEEAISRLQPGVAEHVYELDLNEIGMKNWGSVEAMGTNNGMGIGSTTISVDGEMQSVASWPNDSYSTITGTDGGMQITNERSLIWKQPQYAYMYGWSIGWFQGASRFVVNKENGALQNQTGLEHGGFGKGKRIQVINVLEELDKEGEWYVDNDTSILYIWLTKAPEASHITMSMLKDNFINLYGTEYVTFERLYFGEARGNGVYGKELKDVNFLGCKFNQIGIQAINILESYDCDIISCDIEECGKGGITIGGGDREVFKSGNNVIKNCHMRKFSIQSKTSSYGIMLEGVGNKALNNLLNDIEHQAVGFRGNFNEIAYNEIYNVMTESDDAGAIYAGKSFVSQGNSVNYNFIHDIEKGDGSGNLRMGIYMDDQMCGSEIKGNLIVNCDTAMLLHGGREHTVSDNLSVNCAKGITAIDWSYKTQMDAEDFVMWEDLAASPYKTELWQKTFPRLLNVINDQPAEPKYNTLRNNVDLNSYAKGTNASDNYKNYGTYENNINSDDLSYVYDAENYDFKVNVNSEVYKNNQNLTPIPYEKMGMYYDKYRKKMPQIGDFELVYPANNEKNVEAKSVTFSWQAADNVSEYEFVLAKDKDFKDVVHSETKRGLSSITIENLDYNTTDYYWKVTAKMNTKLANEEKLSVNGPFKFTTAQDEKLDTVNLERMVEKANEMYNNAFEGESVGNYEKGSKAEFYTDILNAKKLLKSKNLKQVQVKETENILKSAMNTFASKGIRGEFYLDEEHLKSGQWTGGTEKQADGSYKILGTNNASKFKVSQFETVHMRVKLNLPPSTWQGITVRNGLNTQPFYSGNTNYGIVVKEDIIEFQQYAKYNDDKGNGVAKIIDNTFIKSGEWYDLEIKTDNTAEGVKITVSVNGEIMFDMTDNRDFSVLQDGYLNMTAVDMCFMPITAE